jgi:PAS domain S-box-containing protein
MFSLDLHSIQTCFEQGESYAMNKNNGLGKGKGGPGLRRFDPLEMLGKLGLQTFQSKMLAGSLFCGGVSVVLICTFSYWSVSSTLSSGQASDLLSRLALSAAVTLVLVGLLAFRFSVSVSRVIKGIGTAVDSVRGGDLRVRAGVRTGDELEELADSFNVIVDRLSETVKAEAEERQELLLINKAIESSSDAIVIKDTVRGNAHYNRRLVELSGYSTEELQSAGGASTLYDDDGASQELLAAFARGESWTGEIGIRTRTGALAPTNVRANVIKDEAGAVIGRIAIHTDITDRKRMEQALKRSELQYRGVFEGASDAIIISEADTENVLEVNSRACEMYGFSRDEFLRVSLKKLKKNGATGDGQAGNPVEQVRGPHLEAVHIRKDGSPISVLGSSSTIEYDGKKVVMGIVRDITDRKKTEDLLEQNLKEFLNLVSIISEGDLTRRGAEHGGMLGDLTASINKMLDNFTAMLTRVKQIGLSVTSSATEILAASEQIAAGSQRQADEITNTSSAVEEMAASMSQVSRNAEASAEAARRALDMAEHGDRSVRDTSEAMVRIDSAVQRTAEKMRLLAKRSSEISEIIDLINDVASQTNLLSLNAAIEAAHAGEAGLGFSVVAEEIRKLAERSARATRDVGSLIKAIQNETSEALEAMENGMKEVRDGSVLANQARQSLQEISGVVRQSAELIEEISAASEEQARVTRNLAGAMQTVSSITLETSAGAHETAQTIQGMVTLTEELNRGISEFRVKDDFIHPFSYESPASGPASPQASPPASPQGHQGNGSQFLGFGRGD